VGEVLTAEAQRATAQEFVEGLIAELGITATVTSRMVDAETAQVAVDGEGLGILVGPGGATLAALQDVTRTFVQGRTNGQSERILVDVAGYRAKRADALQRFARQVADEVIATGEERALEPMTPPDRKVVHDAINGIEGVITRSAGEEPDRFIVIVPASVSGA
jgi:spoIIIJ-associated protein